VTEEQRAQAEPAEPLHPAVPKIEALVGPVAVAQAHGETTITVPAARIRDVARLLRDDPALAYNQLADLTAVDRLALGETPRFIVVYHLLSHRRRERLRLHAPVPSDDAPAIDSVVPVWRAADWLEREVFDMFGIRFEGHPNLARLIMPDDFEGHPLRKDFPIGLEEVEFTHTIGHMGREPSAAS
jgi:NADH-quinone oxidoreductase subunit C